MKKIILCLMFFSSVLYSNNIKMSLVDFVDLYKIQTKKNFLINEKLADDNVFLVFDSDIKNIKLSDFSYILKKRNLKLYSFENYYYIDYFDETKESLYNLHSYKLKNNSYESVKKILYAYFSNQNSMSSVSSGASGVSDFQIVSYINTTNTILFLCKDEDYYKLKKLIEINDKELKTALLKITISETNLNKLKNVGVKYKNLTQIIDFKYLKSYLSLFSANSNDNYLESSKSFYSFIDFLSEKNITDIKASPFLTVKNDLDTSFSIVENIPYLSKNESYENSSKTETSTYNYKDVGLKINIKPLIFDDRVDFSLDISIEDVIDTNSLTPKTSKKNLKGFYTLRKNEILVLSGINKTSYFDTRVGVPLLKDIPFLKYFFSHKSKTKINTSLLITIELIDNKNEISSGESSLKSSQHSASGRASARTQAICLV